MHARKPEKITAQKSIDADRSRLRGAGVRQNMRSTRRALAKLRRDALARCEAEA